MRRIAKIGDGWFPQVPPNDEGKVAIERLHSYAQEEGRDPSTIGIEARISVGQGTPDDWLQALEAWKALGATHLAINTMGAGLTSPQAHIDAIRRFKEVLPSS